MSEGFSRIVVPTDFSACSHEAWALASADFAAAFGSELIPVHVLVREPAVERRPVQHGSGARGVRHGPDLGARGARQVGRAGKRRQASRVRPVLRTGAPHEEIVALATDELADLLVIGTHGRGGMSRVLLGSVADRVVRLAPCPVLTVRGPA